MRVEYIFKFYNLYTNKISKNKNDTLLTFFFFHVIKDASIIVILFQTYRDIF